MPINHPAKAFVARIFLQLAGIILVLSAAAHPLYGVDLKIVTSEHPPFSYTEEGVVKGLAAEIVTALLEDLRLDVEIVSSPWPRTYKTALETKNILIFTLARTPEREDLFDWVGVIIAGNSYLFALNDRKDINIASLEDAKKYRIGIVRNDVRANFLKANGITLLDEVIDSEANAQKLAKGWIDLWAEEENTAPYLFKKLGYDSSQTLNKAFLLDLHMEGYLAFARGSDKDLVDSFRDALQRLKNSGKYQQIVNKYNTVQE